MFELVEPAPPDAILGITEAFQNDSNPDKINLSVGVYKDANGVTPVLDCVKQVEQQLVREEKSKGYLAITGNAEYDCLVPALLLGSEHAAIAAGRVATAQTPGGTGALRVAADLIHTAFPRSNVWLSQPTWPNHPNIFSAAGVTTHPYAYYDPEPFSLDFDAMRQSIENIPEGDVVVLHGCCHNPTGVDLQPDQWTTIGKLARERGLLPLVDFAYQGFGDGLDEDAEGMRRLVECMDELIICSSFSKNFGLYNERVGALTIITKSLDTTRSMVSRIKKCIRANYSNPPAHGAAIVAGVLRDGNLRNSWKSELESMRGRIHSLRHAFSAMMKKLESPVDFSFIEQQRGMFSFSGLTPVQVDKLKNKYSIYIVGNGRINVAGMQDDRMEHICSAILNVLA